MTKQEKSLLTDWFFGELKVVCAHYLAGEYNRAYDRYHAIIGASTLIDYDVPAYVKLYAGGCIDWHDFVKKVSYGEN